MKLLLDTHIWLWYALGNSQLSDNLRSIIASDATGCVSLSKKENHTNLSRLVMATGEQE